MKQFIVLMALCAVALAQNRYDPRQAAIVSEQRYLTGDGSFGTSYKQEDGTDFKEETDASGNRRGSYSYVDASGQKRTISYTAGKDGFMATGDHLPQPHVPPPQYTPDPKYNPPQYQEPQYEEPQQYQQPQYRPQPQQQYQQPQPQYQQPQTQYQQPQPQPQYQQPQQQYQQPQQQYQQPQQQYRPQPQPQYQPQYTTTPAPHRFYPPGKLSLQRSPDGFAYSFNKS